MKITTDFSSVLSQFTRLTHRQTEFSSQDRVCIPCSVVKTVISQKLQIVSRSIWGSSWYRQLHFLASLTLPTSNPIWLPATILKKMIWRHNSADDHPITTKFDRQMQNGMPMTIHGSKSKPEIELKYGCLPCFESGSSYISAVDWVISSKLGTHYADRFPPS